VAVILKVVASAIPRVRAATHSTQPIIHAYVRYLFNDEDRDERSPEYVTDKVYLLACLHEEYTYSDCL